MSSPEDERASSWVSLPVAIKTNTQVESAEPLNLASETADRVSWAFPRSAETGWREAARQGYAWRQRRRAKQLCSLPAACVTPGGVVGGEAFWLAPPGAGVLVETLRELATKGKRTSTSGKSSGEGAGS